eukprot:TRINITY_DN1937_c0_g1_i1.p1 TRINITY_DN1937_c0_g1~~TRINITY_DN1937_c0_g1_i1.p1  ORF type:complete len:429 (-),score=202.86 TRINITY_DN1937_c0_g1_i1:134-1420(-)
MKNIDDMLVKDLKAELKKLGLSISGKKSILKERLIQALEEQNEKEDNDDEEGEINDEKVDEGEEKINGKKRKHEETETENEKEEEPPLKKQKLSEEINNDEDNEIDQSMFDDNDEQDLLIPTKEVEMELSSSKENEKNIDTQENNNNNNNDNNDNDNDNEENNHENENNNDENEKENGKEEGEVITKVVKKKILKSRKKKEEEEKNDVTDPIKTISSSSKISRGALYITGFKRPLTIPQVISLLTEENKYDFEFFFMNSIKSFCYIIYYDEEIADIIKEVTNKIEFPVGNRNYLNPKSVEPKSVFVSIKEHKNERSATTIDKRENKDDEEKKEENNEEEEEIDNEKKKKLESLFQKTNAQPVIYWRTLSEDEIVLRELDKLPQQKTFRENGKNFRNNRNRNRNYRNNRNRDRGRDRDRDRDSKFIYNR